MSRVTREAARFGQTLLCTAAFFSSLGRSGAGGHNTCDVLIPRGCCPASVGTRVPRGGLSQPGHQACDVGSGIFAFWWIFSLPQGSVHLWSQRVGIGVGWGAASMGFLSICEEPRLSPWLRVGAWATVPPPSPHLLWALP